MIVMKNKMIIQVNDANDIDDNKLIILIIKCQSDLSYDSCQKILINPQKNQHKIKIFSAFEYLRMVKFEKKQSWRVPHQITPFLYAPFPPSRLCRIFP